MLFIASGLSVFQALAQQVPGQPLPGQPRAPQILPAPQGPAPQVFNFAIPVPKAVCEATAAQLQVVMDAKTSLTKNLTQFMEAHAREVMKRSKRYKSSKASSSSKNIPDNIMLSPAVAEYNASIALLSGQQAQLSAQMMACGATFILNNPNGKPLARPGKTAKVNVAATLDIGDSKR